MSVIVKGMTINKKDAQSCICTINMLRNLAYNTTGVLDWIDHENCDKIIKMLETLIELPPHGRLIDIRSVEDGKFVTVGNDYQRWWNGALESVIDNAPTVIEAEGSET